MMMASVQMRPFVGCDVDADVIQVSRQCDAGGRRVAGQASGEVELIPRNLSPLPVLNGLMVE